jgi:peptidoglycan/xylan/chitin deacetylase (PgdA/CDA1 family)
LREILKELSLPRPVSDVIPVAITFDDGYRNLITHAHPIMEKYHIPYTVFVPTGFIGGLASWRRDNHLPLLTDQELLELKRTGLVDFGSHTVHHCSMASLSEEEMTKEARLSKNHLSELLQDDSVDMFAYPHGGPSDVSNQTARILRKIGYNLAVTNRSGSMNSYRRRLALRRITFYEGDDERIMLAKLSGEYDWYYLKELVANFARKLVFA